MSDFIEYTHALKFCVTFSLKTPLLLRSGFEGDFTDSTIEKTPDGKELHINGYVWASLLRRSMERLTQYQTIASEIGKFEKPEEKGVSPFWFESSFVPLKVIDIRPGIKIDRKYESTSTGALYTDEFVPPGHRLTSKFICFHNGRRTEELKNAISAALWVVNEGIENIGGGWSYGYGRVKVEKILYEDVDLTKNDTTNRQNLWKGIKDNAIELKQVEDKDISKKWKNIKVKAKIASGQLIAIHSNYLPYFSELPTEIKALTHLPDTFVFRRYNIKDEEVQTEIAIPGKAIRQALFSVPIERKLRTKSPDKICSTPAEYCTCKICEAYRKNGKKGNSPECTCLRCRWFGSTENGGIIAVTDAVIEEPETEIINRIQLCEHSMQNINLFSGEYLKKGEFGFEVIIDCSRDTYSEELMNEIKWLLNDIKTCPPGWYRIGATSTCTGQIEIVEVPPELKTAEKV